MATLHSSDSARGSGMKPTAWKFALRALKARNYRLFFSGQTVSLIGTWMTRIATSWLVYRLTNSPFLLGVVGFAGQIPGFVLAPFAGVWVDRWDRHRTLVITQILSMLQSFALARPAQRKAVLHELKEGWDYVVHFVPIRSILLLLALVSLVGMPYTVLMPIFAGSILHGGAHTLGFLMGASGVGALAGALMLAARRSVLGLGRILPVSAALFGASLIGFALS